MSASPYATVSYFGLIDQGMGAEVESVNDKET